jgi:hypothetical protein
VSEISAGKARKSGEQTIPQTKAKKFVKPVDVCKTGMLLES